MISSLLLWISFGSSAWASLVPAERQALKDVYVAGGGDYWIWLNETIYGEREN
jgi:hypothetical protein